MKLSALFLTSFLAFASALPKAGAVEWEPFLELDKDVFPSLLISTATVDWDAEEEDEDTAAMLGDHNGWFGVWLSDVPEGAKVKVEIKGDSWVKPSKIELKADEAYDEVYVMPKMVYDYDALAQVRQQRPTNITFKVTINGKVLGEETVTCILHEINDCPYLVDKGEDESPFDLTWMFAAYVNENHPWIDSLLKDALSTGIVDSFTGYQSEDPEVVMTQVFAIWHTLQRRGIKYSDITTNPGSKHVYSQTVRFVEDSVDATQANCVDGSVLMASILRKIGLNVYLVMVPGHCYLAFDTDAEGKEIVGLETTMLGNDNLKPLKDVLQLPQKLLKKEHDASYKTFLAAIEEGTKDYKKNRRKFSKEDELDYQLVPISDAREFGIMPLASAKGKQ